jgi:hypothetical protein
MASFKNFKSKQIGTTEVVIDDIASPTIITGCNIANVSGSSATISLYIVVTPETGDPVSYYILKDKRIDGGANFDAITGNKIFLEAGDSLRAISATPASFDIIVSTVDGV